MYRTPGTVDPVAEIEIVRESSRQPVMFLAVACGSLVMAVASAVTRFLGGPESALPIAVVFVLAAVLSLFMWSVAFKRLVVSHVAEERALVVVLVARSTSRERHVFHARPEVELKYVHQTSTSEGPDRPDVYKVVLRGAPKGAVIEKLFVKETANRIASALRAAIATWPPDDN